MKIKQINITLFILGLLPILFWIYKYINVDLWYDEVYSLDQFVLRGFSTTLFDYSVPNNHVFFNITSIILLKITGLGSLNEIANHAYVLRIFQVLITLFTGYYSYLITENFFKSKYSLLVVPILFSCVPFMNFSLQLRGYNMSSLFLIMIVYHTMRLINKKNKRDSIFVIIASMLLIYTIPSNIYMLATILIILGIRFLSNKKTDRNDYLFYLQPIVLIGIGIGIAILLYSPILYDIIFNDFSARTPDSIFYSLELIPTLLHAFLSGRSLLALLFIIGIWFFLRESDKKEKQLFIALLLLLLLPFVLAFLHHKLPFQRVFVTLSPIFCLVLSIPIIKLIQKNTYQLLNLGFVFLIPIYCLFTFVNETNKNDQEITKQLVSAGIKTQNIYQNYYLSSSFNPKETMKLLKVMSGNDTIVKYNQFDYPATNLYLKLNEVKFIEITSLEELEDMLLTKDKTIILTSQKNSTLDDLELIGKTEAVEVMDTYPFTNIISTNN